MNISDKSPNKRFLIESGQESSVFFSSLVHSGDRVGYACETILNERVRWFCVCDRFPLKFWISVHISNFSTRKTFVFAFVKMWSLKANKTLWTNFTFQIYPSFSLSLFFLHRFRKRITKFECSGMWSDLIIILYKNKQRLNISVWLKKKKI